MAIGTLPQFALIAESVELTEELKRDIGIVKYNVEEYNKIPNPTAADKEKLDGYVDDFNHQQQVRAVKGPCSSPAELLNLYVQKRFVPQIRLGQHGTNRKYCIEFKLDELTFCDFCNAHKKEVDMRMNSLAKELCTLCYYLYENMVNSLNGEIPLKYYAQFMDRTKNPYSCICFLRDSFTFSRESLASKKKIRIALTEIAREYFPDVQIPYIHASELELFLHSISHSISPDRILNRFIDVIVFSAYPQLKKQHKNKTSAKSRHVAWCTYEHNRRCMKLDIECYSSVSCPFYREASNKT